MSDPSQEVGSWFSRNMWLLSAIWLVFLIFPLLSVVVDDDLSGTERTIGVIGMAVFVAVYIHGFWRQNDHERRSLLPWSRVEEREYHGRIHAGLLIALNISMFAVVGPAVLGVTPFVVSFFVFHFSWPVAWIAVIGGVAITTTTLFVVEAFGDLWFLALIVASVGLATMLIRSAETTQADRSQLLTELAVTGERNRVARDVHDVLGHSLTAVIIKAELCERLLVGVDAADDDQRRRLASCREQLDELRSVSRSALAEIRATVGGLRASNLADEVTVARTVLADAGVGLLVTGEVTDVPVQHRPLLAWVVREAVTNIVRHADASQCHIDLRPDGAGRPAVLRVSDDGVGFDPTARPDGNGLRGVRERIEAVGGELVIRTDTGTALEVAIR